MDIKIGTHEVEVKNKRLRIEEMLPHIDQLEAWKQILNITIPFFREKSIKFCSPFREDSSPGCHLVWYKDRICFMDHADPNYHGIDCIGALAKLKGVNPGVAARMLYDDLSISINVEKSRQAPSSNKKFVFRVLFDYRSWNKKDKERFDPLQLDENDLLLEGWKPIKKLSFNSRNSPDKLITVKTNGYAISIGRHHKIYCPGEDINFLSTVPAHTIAGNSRLIPGKPLLINKSAKDHAVVAKQEYNSRFIVNGEGDKPDGQFLWWAALYFPAIIFLYDNDKAGIEYSNQWAQYGNDLTQTEKFFARHLPMDEKDPSDWMKRFDDLKIIDKIIKEL